MPAVLTLPQLADGAGACFLSLAKGPVMNPSSANAVIDALSSSILDRLKKGEPLDPDATYLYAELVKESGAQTQSDGRYATQQLIAQTAIEIFSKIERALELRDERVKGSRFGAPASVNQEQSQTPRQRAVRAVVEAHKTTMAVADEGDEAGAQDALDSALRTYDDALRTEMIAEARRSVLAALENRLLDTIAQYRMLNGKPDFIQQLEEKLLATKIELAALRDVAFLGMPAARKVG